MIYKMKEQNFKIKCNFCPKCKLKETKVLNSLLS